MLCCRKKKVKCKDATKNGSGTQNEKHEIVNLDSTIRYTEEIEEKDCTFGEVHKGNLKEITERTRIVCCTICKQK